MKTIPAPLQEFLEDETILKYAVNHSHDTKSIQLRFPSVKCAGFVELSTLFPSVPRDSRSLHGLVSYLLNQYIDKRIGHAFWEMPELTEAQLAYAANDALGHFSLAHFSRTCMCHLSCGSEIDLFLSVGQIGTPVEGQVCFKVKLPAESLRWRSDGEKVYLEPSSETHPFVSLFTSASDQILAFRTFQGLFPSHLPSHQDLVSALSAIQSDPEELEVLLVRPFGIDPIPPLRLKNHGMVAGSDNSDVTDEASDVIEVQGLTQETQGSITDVMSAFLPASEDESDAMQPPKRAPRKAAQSSCPKLTIDRAHRLIDQLYLGNVPSPLILSAKFTKEQQEALRTRANGYRLTTLTLGEGPFKQLRVETPQPHEPLLPDVGVDAVGYVVVRSLPQGTHQYL